MYKFIKKGIRGGISNISHRHSIANNKYMKNYDPTKESKYIVYLDANNLYGWAMQQKVSIGNYKWENPSLFTEEYINNINENGQSVYILEVDLEYPQSLHEYHNSYPLCPERKLIKTEMLSKFQLNLKEKLNISNDHVEKLICDLTDKNIIWYTIKTYNYIYSQV